MNAGRCLAHPNFGWEFCGERANDCPGNIKDKLRNNLIHNEQQKR